MFTEREQAIFALGNELLARNGFETVEVNNPTDGMELVLRIMEMIRQGFLSIDAAMQTQELLARLQSQKP